MILFMIYFYHFSFRCDFIWTLAGIMDSRFFWLIQTNLNFQPISNSQKSKQFNFPANFNIQKCKQFNFPHIFQISKSKQIKISRQICNVNKISSVPAKDKCENGRSQRRCVQVPVWSLSKSIVRPRKSQRLQIDW